MNRLSVLLGLARLNRRFFLAPSREPAFLVAEVRTGFQFVVLTLVAVEVQDFLRVRGTHAPILARCRVVGKRTTLPSRGWSF